MPDFPTDIRPAELADIAVVGLIFWALIAWARRVHAAMALAGLAFLGVVYLLAEHFSLELTARIFQGFFAVVVVLLVVVFQDDLRRLFEQIAAWGLLRRRPAVQPGALAAVVRSLERLASERTGALLVFPGREPLGRHLRGGVVLDATVSEEVLLSLFDSSSPGHDGAVVVRGGRIERFGVHLPLSGDHAQLGPGGTRHAAALGLAERCDALCVVVSEERGTVALAQAGRLRVLDRPEKARQEIEHYLARTQPGRRRRRRWRVGASEAVVAFILAMTAWLALGPGNKPITARRRLAVEVDLLPAGYAFKRSMPDSVEVEIAGPQRILLWAEDGDWRLRVPVDTALVKLKRRSFWVGPENVEVPQGVKVLAVRPAKIELDLAAD
jgi:diadenylate cyclase